MHLPSKELLSKVLGVYITEFFLDCESLVYVYDKIFNENEQYKNDINIYELAYKCKEWLIAKTDNDITISINRDMASVTLYIKEDADFHIEFADTEVEAIIKACEWILKNKDK